MNYVYNRVICNKEILNKYFIDTNPFNDGDKRCIENPYITFNKICDTKDIGEYIDKYDTSIYYGDGFYYRELKDDLYEIKFVTMRYYPIIAIIKIFEKEHDLIWYAVEENNIYISKFYWKDNELKESFLNLETDEFEKFYESTEDIEYEDYDSEVWYFSEEGKREWIETKAEHLKEKYFKKYEPYKLIDTNENEYYYYLTVKYEDYDGYKEYNYISDDYSIEVGDRVLVDRAGNPAIAEVLETEFYNKFEVPFPVEKTKKIIQKVDDNFELDDLYVEEELQNKIRFNIDGTKIYFGIENYKKGENNDDDWTNIILKVSNRYFNYYNNSELMTSAEVERLLKKLEELLEDKLNKDENIGFYEPDLEFHLYPKLNLWDTGKYTYIKEGHEIQDIYVELSINLTDSNGVYTGQKYVLIFDRKEIELIVKYINEIIK